MFSCKPDTHTGGRVWVLVGVGSQVNNLLSAHNQRDNNETQPATWHLDTTGAMLESSTKGKQRHRKPHTHTPTHTQVRTHTGLRAGGHT